MQTPSIPFKILALAPFRATDDIAWSERPLKIDKDNFDQVMDELGLSLYIRIPQDLCPAGGLDIRCKTLKDFHPDGLIQNNDFLNNLLNAKKFVQEATAKGTSSDDVVSRLKEWPELPPIQFKAAPQKPKKSSAELLEDILEMMALPGEESSTPSAGTNTLTDQIDHALQQILGHIYSHEKFRELEATWRGMKLLLQQGEINGDIRLEVAPVSFETLDESLDLLIAQLIEDLPSLILVDLPFDNSPGSLEFIETIGQFAEKLMVPTILWITHNFLYIDTWKDLEKLPFLPHYLERPEFAKWRRLRESALASWLTVTCNRFLVRYPYGRNNLPRLVPFHEWRNLWCSPVWALGCLVGQSVAKYGWPTRFTAWQHMKVVDLALSGGDTSAPRPTEASFAENRIDQFIRGGITPLVAQKGKDVAFAPAESTLAGGSLGYQAFLSRITQLILWCNDNFKEGLEPVELQEGLKRTFSLFWEKSGHSGPEDLEISAGHPDPDNRIPLHITLKPSRQILPTGEKVEMDFVW
jgi:type VI secretion system ImpB/VipA family protein